MGHRDTAMAVAIVLLDGKLYYCCGCVSLCHQPHPGHTTYHQSHGHTIEQGGDCSTGLISIFGTLLPGRSVRCQQIFSWHLSLEQASWCHFKSCPLLSSPSLLFSSMQPLVCLVSFFLVVPIKGQCMVAWSGSSIWHGPAISNIFHNAVYACVSPFEERRRIQIEEAQERRKASADDPDSPDLFPCPHCPRTCKSRIRLHNHLHARGRQEQRWRASSSILMDYHYVC